MQPRPRYPHLHYILCLGEELKRVEHLRPLPQLPHEIEVRLRAVEERLVDLENSQRHDGVARRSKG